MGRVYDGPEREEETAAFKEGSACSEPASAEKTEEAAQTPYPQNYDSSSPMENPEAFLMTYAGPDFFAAQQNGMMCQPMQNNPEQTMEPSAPQILPDGRWKCECGTVNDGKFCMECGRPRPLKRESDGAA